MLTPTTSAVAARTGWSGTGSWSSGFTTVEVGSCRCRRCLRYASQIGGYAAGGYAAYSNSKHRTAVPREDFSLEPKTLRPRRGERIGSVSVIVCVHRSVGEWEVVSALGLAQSESQFGAVAA